MYRPKWRPGDYNGGERAGREADGKAEMTLTITTPTLDSFMVDKRYTATAQGTVKVAGITDAGGAAVRNGVFHLFLAGREGDFYRRTMLYRLPFSGADGNRYVLEGFKDVRDHGGFDVWSATTTLYTSVQTADGKVVASGILRVLLPDFLKQLTTFRVTGTDNIRVKTVGLARFFGLFVGTLFEVFVRPRMPGAWVKLAAPDAASARICSSPLPDQRLSKNSLRRRNAADLHAGAGLYPPSGRGFRYTPSKLKA